MNEHQINASNLDIYYILTLIHRHEGLGFNDIPKILSDNGLAYFENKWSGNIRRSSIPEISFSTPVKKFIYDQKVKKYFPLKEYLLNNLESITYTIEDILSKNITTTITKDLTILLSDIKNNSLVMSDRILGKSKKVSKKGTGERQKHGFDYEYLIRERYGMIKSNSYTAEWDSPLFNDMPASIKCIQQKIGSVDLGDFLRQSKIKEDFLIFIGFWCNDKHNIVEEYIVKIKKENWEKYLGNTDIIEEMKKELVTISNDIKDDGKWEIFRNKWGEKYTEGKTPTIALRFKRDHGTQKRIQCGITYKNFKEIILVENEIITLETVLNEKVVN